MDKLLKDLGIDETYTKAPKLPKKYNKVKDNIPLKEDYNFMADILMLPETEEGFKYLLVVVDLATDEFDIEPMKTKQPEEALKAIKTMFKRKFIDEPYASIRTDGGTEFQGVFAKWLYDENIMHKKALPDRHKQMANVERLNKDLGRLFNGYMNAMEEETGEEYRQWTDVLDKVRKDLNKIRKKDVSKNDPVTDEYPVPKFVEPKYKVGDIVYHISEVPRNALGHKQPTKNFRMGDYRWNMTPRKIVKVLPYPNDVQVRYVLDHMPNVSYAEYELKPAKEKVEKFVVKQILDKKVEKKKIFYKVWWKGYKKEEATWEPKSELEKDISALIEQYEKKNKK